MPDKRSVRNINELVKSTINFGQQPEYWREAVGSSPKYFTHYVENNRHYFGLSKYCAFRNVSLRQYVISLRNTTNGNITQKHISRLAEMKWIPFSDSSRNVQQAFSEWIHSFFPAYILVKASFITLNPIANRIFRKQKRQFFISPRDLQNKLRQQTKIGNVGELIALKYEVSRLRKTGISNPEERVDHVSKRNSAAGYDIWSRSSKDKEGKVICEVQNPIKHLEISGTLEPILYKAQINKNKNNIEIANGK